MHRIFHFQPSGLLSCVIKNQSKRSTDAAELIWEVDWHVWGTLFYSFYRVEELSVYMKVVSDDICSGKEHKAVKAFYRWYQAYYNAIESQENRFLKTINWKSFLLFLIQPRWICLSSAKLKHMHLFPLAPGKERKNCIPSKDDQIIIDSWK